MTALPSTSGMWAGYQDFQLLIAVFYMQALPPGKMTRTVTVFMWTNGPGNRRLRSRLENSPAAHPGPGSCAHHIPTSAHLKTSTTTRPWRFLEVRPRPLLLRWISRRNSSLRLLRSSLLQMHPNLSTKPPRTVSISASTSLRAHSPATKTRVWTSVWTSTCGH